MSESDIAATPDNFDAQIAASEAVADSTGPSNQNGWSGQLESDDGPPLLNPHQSRDLRNPNANDETDVTDAQDTPMDDGDEEGEEGDELEEGEETEEVEEEQEEGQPTYEQYQEAWNELQQSEDMPEWLMDKMAVANINGRQYRVTMREAIEGYQRLSDYSRGKQELTQAMQQAESVTNRMRGMVNSWKDPQELYKGMQRLGLEKVFAEAAIAWAGEEMQFRQLPPEAQQAFQRAREAERRAEALESQLRRQQQQQPPQQVPRQQVDAYLAQTLPKIFEHYQIMDCEPAWKFMIGHTRALWDADPNTIGYALDRAARATVEDLQRLAQTYREAGQSQEAAQVQQQATRMQKKAALGPRAVPGAAPPQAKQRGTRRGGGNLGDFERLLEGYK